MAKNVTETAQAQDATTMSFYVRRGTGSVADRLAVDVSIPTDRSDGKFYPHQADLLVTDLSITDQHKTRLLAALTAIYNQIKTDEGF